MLPTPVVDAEIDHLEIANQFLIGYTPGTRESYKRDLEKWFDFCSSASLSPLGGTRGAAQAFQALLSDHRGLSGASVARTMAATSSFYRYAVQEGLIDANPFDSVRRPVVGNDRPDTGTSAEELQNLIKRAKNDSPRSYALVMLLTFTGMRISEALNANVGDLGYERGVNTLKVTRKGGKTAKIPLTEQVYVAIQAIVEGGDPNRPIFNTKTGGRFHRAEAHKLLGRLGGTHCHAIRHAFVTLSLEAGVPLHEVQKAAGHSDPRTTMRYNDARDRLNNETGHALQALLTTV